MKKQIKLNVSIDEETAQKLEEKRKKLEMQVGIDISIASIARKAILFYLLEENK